MSATKVKLIKDYSITAGKILKAGRVLEVDDIKADELRRLGFIEPLKTVTPTVEEREKQVIKKTNK